MTTNVESAIDDALRNNKRAIRFAFACKRFARLFALCMDCICIVIDSRAVFTTTLNTNDRVIRTNCTLNSKLSTAFTPAIAFSMPLIK